MTRLVSFLAVLFMAVSMQAGVGVSVGARAGFNITHLRKFTAPDTYKKRVGLGSDIAGVLRIDFNKYIGIQTEVEFSQKGQGWKKSVDSAKLFSKWVINYVQFPVLAVAHIGSAKVKAVLIVGPYVGYWTGGYFQNSTTIDKQTRHEDHTTYKFTKDDMRVDVGLVTGLGTDIKVGKGVIEIMARHNLGLLSITKNNLPKLYNCNFGFSVGYLFMVKSID